MSISKEFKEKLKGDITKEDFVKGMLEAGLARGKGDTSRIDLCDNEGDFYVYDTKKETYFYIELHNQKGINVRENFELYKKSLIEGNLIQSCSLPILSVDSTVFLIGLEMEGRNKKNETGLKIKNSNDEIPENRLAKEVTLRNEAKVRKGYIMKPKF